ncbi:MAG: hypothetical protein ACQESR_05060 [Planctomycetota bacterium]
MESRPTQAVLPLVGLAAEKVIRHQSIALQILTGYSSSRRDRSLEISSLAFRAWGLPG